MVFEDQVGAIAGEATPAFDTDRGIGGGAGQEDFAGYANRNLGLVGAIAQPLKEKSIHSYI
ncbi:hypothetical protein GN244_ATG16846 [Phytophthora infestans]|uniref:Uncharacterized protein n=1 Tax=Phytophthora infestans TaxID=4787 RepID=A0A833SI53_PHYIN|nr:hypothetical protein GN244_ATG16846 [Phytophthora infestans]